MRSASCVAASEDRRRRLEVHEVDARAQRGARGGEPGSVEVLQREIAGAPGASAGVLAHGVRVPSSDALQEPPASRDELMELMKDGPTQLDEPQLVVGPAGEVLRAAAVDTMS